MRGWREHLTFECPYCNEVGEHFCLPGLYVYIENEAPETMEALNALYESLVDRELIPPLEEMYDRIEAFEEELDTAECEAE